MFNPFFLIKQEQNLYYNHELVTGTDYIELKKEVVYYPSIPGKDL